MTHQQQVARLRACNTLAHYLRHAYEAAGLPWDADNRGEIKSIVDDIIFAATPEHLLPE